MPDDTPGSSRAVGEVAFLLCLAGEAITPGVLHLLGLDACPPFGPLLAGYILGFGGWALVPRRYKSLGDLDTYSVFFLGCVGFGLMVIGYVLCGGELFPAVRQ
jgi:hypothetical protein